MATRLRRRKPRRLPDRGTPEAQARKRELVGAGDPALAEYPLGVLLARGLISPAQHDAGRHYAYLAGRVLGRTRPYRPDAGSGGAELGDGALAAVEDRWRAAVAALLTAGRRAKDAVDNVALFERMPPRLLRREPRVGDALEHAALAAGLDALAAWRGGRRAIRAECDPAAALAQAAE